MNKINIDDLYSVLIDIDITDATEILESQYGMEVYDEDYDNPGDNPDEYVMYRAFSNGSTDVILYYLNTDDIVSEVVVR